MATARIKRFPSLCGALTVALFCAAVGAAHAEDVTPMVSPDRLEDVPSTRVDPFPAFDNFAWRAFIALNWPARSEPEHRGEPDRERRPGDPGPRVWETFKARYEAFPPEPAEPAEPAPWSQYASLNPCGGSAKGLERVIAQFEPYAEFNQAGFTPGKLENPLIAQNRTYVRYEVRVNEAEFDTIVEHKLYARQNAPTAERPIDFAIGSIAVKAAWRLLNAADTPAIRARYYVVANAEVVDVARSRAAGGVVCSRSDVALVGLHIAVKTRYRPQWIWSTFEHIDNVPPIGKGDAREPDAHDAGAPYAFDDPALPQGGVQPAAVDSAHPPLVDPEPMQVVRKHPIRTETMAMNRAYWALPQVRGTVWAHYMLVATQWPTVTHPVGPDNDGRYFPGLRIDGDTPGENYQSDDQAEVESNLVNTTMETYAQDQPSSCMACHNAASNARGRDFVAILPNAD